MRQARKPSSRLCMAVWSNHFKLTIFLNSRSRQFSVVSTMRLEADRETSIRYRLLAFTYVIHHWKKNRNDPAVQG